MRKSFLSVLLVMVLSFSFTVTSFAAPIGSKLPTPEDGWTRFDDTNTFIKYEGKWSTFKEGQNSQYFWLDSHHLTTTIGDTASFKFSGTKIRFVNNNISRNSPKVQFTIDGVAETVSTQGTTAYLSLVYEKTNLEPGIHTVEVKNLAAGELLIDAIDIDGELIDPSNPGPQPQPEPSGDRALLTVTMTTGLEKEYDLSMDEVNAFINWYDAKDAGSGPSKYAINKHNNNKGPFSKRTDYVIFNNILTFEVNEYTATSATYK